MKDYDSGFVTCPKEICVDLIGDYPSDLSGTYFRNGHSKFEVGSQKVFPLDCDGMITAVTFNEGNATFRNRFVKTEGYSIEKKFNRISARGAFRTFKDGGLFSNFWSMKPKNTANTNVVFWAGRLLALWPGGRPHLLEPDSLRTVGEYKLRAAALVSSDQLAAFPKLDNKNKRLVCCVKSNNKISESQFIFHEFDQNFDLYQSK
jgi:all-trans-8'-apo-beta-carotenal 15,15'-oxygenase